MNIMPSPRPNLKSGLNLTSYLNNFILFLPRDIRVFG